MHTPYILCADDLGDFSGIPLETPILDADDFLGACCRKAMTLKNAMDFTSFLPIKHVPYHGLRRCLFRMAAEMDHRILREYRTPGQITRFLCSACMAHLDGPIRANRFADSHRPLNGPFRGAVFRHGGGALKQPIKEPTETPTSTLALMGRFPSLMGRFPTLMGRFTDFVPRGRFTSLKIHWKTAH